jgi:hypothetical protein
MLAPLFLAFNGESRDDEAADARSQTDRQADVAGPGRSGLLNRPRRALDGDQRPRHRHGGTVLADRGYYKSEQILDCEQAGIKTLAPKPQTSTNNAAGQSFAFR